MEEKIKEVINLTGHDINIVTNEGKLVKTFPTKGMVRIENREVPKGELVEGVPNIDIEFSVPQWLPEKREGVVYIVSKIVCERCKDRDDFYMVASSIRSKDGSKILGVKGLTKNPYFEELDIKIIDGLEKMYNNFLNWFDKFSDWAINDLWLVKVSFKEENGKSEFFWDSSDYEFGFEIRDYENEEIILKVDIYQPRNISFKRYISKEEADKLIEKAKEINNFYSDKEKELMKIKKKVLSNVFNRENGFE